MNGNLKRAFFIALFAGALSLLVFFIRGSHILIFDPQGPISAQERNLIVIATSMMLLVIIPTFAFAAYIAWKYRAGNARAKYSPDTDHNWTASVVMWAVPATVIFTLAIMNWQSTHALDPYRPLLRQGSEGQALAIQVVALRWKWLFIYPEQGIATVNFMEFPSQAPLDLALTSDAPMNSFWIPQLGGQMYAMAGMRTQLHLMADAPGEYAGSAAEINGPGFAGMRFTAKAVPQEAFDRWVQSVKQSSSTLDLGEYEKLAEPSENVPPAFYSSADVNLYTEIMAKFMPPHPSGSMPGMGM